MLHLEKYTYIKGNHNSLNKNENCYKNCPVALNQNDIYKLYDSYKLQREKNDSMNNNFVKRFFLKLSTNKGPSNIFIIRHGEKIHHSSTPDLSCNGILRSSIIPQFIGTLNNKGYKIDAIVTINQYNSMHVEQTVMLASWLLGIPLFIYGTKNEQKITVNTIFNNKYFHNKNILICWEHTCIQELIKDIITIGPKVKGIKNYTFINPNGNSGLPKWDTNNFNSVIHFNEQLKFDTFSENIKTCNKNSNSLLTYGVKQNCNSSN
jgi:hypothetical protein